MPIRFHSRDTTDLQTRESRSWLDPRKRRRSIDLHRVITTVLLILVMVVAGVSWGWAMAHLAAML